MTNLNMVGDVFGPACCVVVRGLRVLVVYGVLHVCILMSVCQRVFRIWNLQSTGRHMHVLNLVYKHYALGQVSTAHHIVVLISKNTHTCGWLPQCIGTRVSSASISHLFACDDNILGMSKENKHLF